MKQIPMFKVGMSPDVNHDLLSVIHSGWIGQGQKVVEFEKELSLVFSNDKVLSLSSGTHGLSLALRLAGVGVGDEVITTPLTCLSYLTSIETDQGFMTIGKIVNQKLDVKVKSLNEQTGQIEWKKITNWIKLPSDDVEWYNLFLENGNSSNSKLGKRSIWITGDHRVLTYDGWKRVDELKQWIDKIATDYKSPNKKQMEFLNGTMLGDAHLQSCRNTSRLTINHCIEQNEWVEFKKKALNGFDIQSFIKKKEEKTVGVGFQTETSIFFKNYRREWYNSRKVKSIPESLELTPLTLATWYMDDGSFGYYHNDDGGATWANSAILCTECFSHDSFWNLFYKLVDLGLKPRAIKRGNGNRIYIENNPQHYSADKFFKIISPYIIPSMRYKLPVKLYNGEELDDFNPELWNLGETEVLFDYVIAKKGDPPKSHKPNNVYCLEVEDNHNFITKNMIVSNCTATNMPILQAGADIVWADVKEDFNIDPESIEDLITEKTKAIIVVHWGGYPCDMKKIYAIVRKHIGLKIIEDCAHAYGSSYLGHPMGDCYYSDYAMFSFQAIKHLTTVDGGALCCKFERDYKRGKLLRWYGIDREGPRSDFRCEDDIAEWGYKFHMNDVCATIGIENMDFAQENVFIAMSNAAFYDKELSGLSGIEITQVETDRVSSSWLYTMLVENRSDFTHMMGSKGISVSRVHERNDKHTCFAKYQRELPGLESIIDKMICIPVGFWVTQEDRRYIVETIKSGW